MTADERTPDAADTSDAIPRVIGRPINGLSVVSVNGSSHAFLLVSDLGSAELTQLSTSVSVPLVRRLEGSLQSRPMDDRDCTVCQGRRDAASGTTLHLRAHGSRLGSATSGAGLDGDCHLVRVGTQSRIAEIAARGEALLSSPAEPLDDWGVEATWPAISEIRGVVGFPLRFRGRVVGVLACYLRTPADAGMSSLARANVT